MFFTTRSIRLRCGERLDNADAYVGTVRLVNLGRSVHIISFVNHIGLYHRSIAR
jgi:hypothetical protein